MDRREVGRPSDGVLLSSLPVVETPLSRVFFGSDRVWKLKKALTRGDIDWRSLGSRRRACDAEFGMGRRLAEAVYRSVVPVTAADRGGLLVRGSGKVVDWALEMARLPRAQRFDVRFGDGQLGSGSIAAIALHLANFHASAPNGEAVRHHATPPVLRTRIEDALARASRDEPGCVELAHIADRQRAGLESHEAALQSRLATGRIREGHGDLRCDHVYLDDAGGVAVLDPLEGPAASRCADVCADIAMLSVDLLGRGRTDLAERLLAAYAGAADDYDLYSVIDFYERQRAFERACAALSLARDESASGSLRARAAREERKYTQLACAIDRPALLPRTLVATTGLIASGKSTIAATLADRMGVPRIVADTTRLALARRGSTHNDDLSVRLRSLGREFDGRVYAEALRCADVVLSSGRGVVLDACFPTVSARAEVARLALRHEIPLVFVECRAPSEKIYARLAERAEAEGAGADGWIAIYDALAKRFEPFGAIEGGTHQLVNTSEALEANLARLQERIPTWPMGVGE